MSEMEKSIQTMKKAVRSTKKVRWVCYGVAIITGAICTACIWESAKCETLADDWTLIVNALEDMDVKN